MKNELGRLTEIANECFTDFQVVDNQYHDGETKTYQFNYSQFISIKECLKHAEYFLQKWLVEQVSSDLAREVHELKEEIKTLNILANRRHSDLTETRQDVELAKKEALDLLVSLTQRNLELAAKDTELRALRSKLGHAKGKIKRLES